MTPDEKLKDFCDWMGTMQNKLVELINFDYQYISNIEFEDVDHSDAPDYCDAFISYAEYHGTPLDDTLLDKLNEDRDFVYEQLIKYLY